MALRPALVLLVAVDLATSYYQTRRCTCTLQDNRATVSQQVCVLQKDTGQLFDCKNETVPRISPNYEYIEPQGLFSVFRINLRYHHAKIFCEQEGGRLAVPQSVDVYKKLQKMVEHTLGFRAFIGLNDMENEGTWVDIDGHSPPVLPWAKGKPDNFVDEDCSEITSNMLLNDYPCWLQSAFICERRLQRPIPQGYKWCNMANRFYKLVQSEKTFYEARAICRRDGGSLASIDTIEEAECVLKMMPSLWNDPFVDFTDEAAEGQFVDSKGRPMESMEFRIWKPGQPDNGGYYGPQNCVVLVGAGYYVDVSCDDTQPFLCELDPF